MALAATLASVLKPDVVRKFASEDDIPLRERWADMRVAVVGLPADGTAVRVERVGHLSKIRGSCRKICDYLLIVETEGRAQAVFVELKKTWTGGEEPREQLRRSLPLLDYLRSVCEVEYGAALNGANIAVHYAIVFERVSQRLAKQGVRADPQGRAGQERHAGITIRTFIGTRVSFATLTGE